jgi:hypothetical protein
MSKPAVHRIDNGCNGCGKEWCASRAEVTDAEGVKEKYTVSSTLSNYGCSNLKDKDNWASVWDSKSNIYYAIEPPNLPRLRNDTTAVGKYEIVKNYGYKNGGTINFTSCPAGKVVQAIARGGKNSDVCRPSNANDSESYAAWCVSCVDPPDEVTIPAENYKSSRFLSSSWGRILQCNDNEVVTGMCTSGKHADCWNRDTRGNVTKGKTNYQIRCTPANNATNSTYPYGKFPLIARPSDWVANQQNVAAPWKTKYSSKYDGIRTYNMGQKGFIDVSGDDTIAQSVGYTDRGKNFADFGIKLAGNGANSLSGCGDGDVMKAVCISGSNQKNCSDNYKNIFASNSTHVFTACEKPPTIAPTDKYTSAVPHGRNCKNNGKDCINGNKSYQGLNMAILECEKYTAEQCGSIMKDSSGLYYLRRPDDPVDDTTPMRYQYLRKASRQTGMKQSYHVNQSKNTSPPKTSIPHFDVKSADFGANDTGHKGLTTNTIDCPPGEVVVAISKGGKKADCCRAAGTTSWNGYCISCAKPPSGVILCPTNVNRYGTATFGEKVYCKSNEVMTGLCASGKDNNCWGKAVDPSWPPCKKGDDNCRNNQTMSHVIKCTRANVEGPNATDDGQEKMMKTSSPWTREVHTFNVGGGASGTPPVQRWGQNGQLFGMELSGSKTSSLSGCSIGSVMKGVAIGGASDKDVSKQNSGFPNRSHIFAACVSTTPFSDANSFCDGSDASTPGANTGVTVGDNTSSGDGTDSSDNTSSGDGTDSSGNTDNSGGNDDTSSQDSESSGSNPSVLIDIIVPIAVVAVLVILAGAWIKMRKKKTKLAV